MKAIMMDILKLWWQINNGINFDILFSFFALIALKKSVI